MPMTGPASLLTFWGAPRDRARTLLDRRPPARGFAAYGNRATDYQAHGQAGGGPTCCSIMASAGSSGLVGGGAVEPIGDLDQQASSHILAR